MNFMQGKRSVALILSSLVFSLCVFGVQLANAQTETVLHTFTGSPDGATPQQSALLGLGGSFYGVTLFGGSFNYGTVFQLKQDSTRVWHETILYNFTGGDDGKYPLGALIADPAGNLYGVTINGGPQNSGVVFELANSGGQWEETVLHSFGSGFDGADPEGPLVFDASGNLFGTTELGGGLGEGTVYEMQLANGTWTETVLHSFGSTGDGTLPQGAVVLDAAGNVYGTTETGGANSCIGLGCGIAYQLTPGSTGWTENIIHNFAGRADGYYPLPLAIDHSGNLYGATIYGGGLGNCGSGCGTVYELSPAGNGTWTETILHRFIGGSGGSEPSSPLTIDGHGNLFGETALVGSNNGTIFRLSPKTTGGFAFKVLFTFDGTDGSYPQGGVYVAPGGTLFGTTIEGGSSNSGVAFSFRP